MKIVWRFRTVVLLQLMAFVYVMLNLLVFFGMAPPEFGWAIRSLCASAYFTFLLLIIFSISVRSAALVSLLVLAIRYYTGSPHPMVPILPIVLEVAGFCLVFYLGLLKDQLWVELLHGSTLVSRIRLQQLWNEEAERSLGSE